MTPITHGDDSIFQRSDYVSEYHGQNDIHKYFSKYFTIQVGKPCTPCTIVDSASVALERRVETSKAGCPSLYDKFDYYTSITIRSGPLIETREAIEPRRNDGLRRRRWGGCYMPPCLSWLTAGVVVVVRDGEKRRTWARTGERGDARARA